MVYKDIVYGKLEFSEPVILDLINSNVLQRLKDIDQIGYFHHYFPNLETFSRLEHSLGVFALLRKSNALIEEQIAGLIHDVSHAVFSHCIDYVLDSGSEKNHSHQDDIFEEFVRKSEIPDILERYGIDTNFILDKHNFPLLEKELPDLCADRLDYSLRNGIHYKEIDIDKINYFLKNLYVDERKWIFKDFESAKKFAEYFLKMNNIYYSDLSSAKMFRTVGDTLKHALEKEYITKKDLYTTDKQVLDKVKKYLDKDKKLKILFDRMDGKIKIENNPNNYDVKVFCKSRIVDPLCHYNGRILRVSDIEKSWQEVIRKESQPKEYFLKFV